MDLAVLVVVVVVPPLALRLPLVARAALRVAVVAGEGLP